MFRPIGGLHDGVSGGNLSFLKNTKIESGSMMFHEKGWHSRLVHPDANPVTSHTRLTNLEDGAANPKLVPDADFLIEKSFYCEIFAKLPEDKIVASKNALPVSVGFDLIDEDSALFSAVPGEIALAVAIDVQFAHEATAFDGILPDRCANGLAIPRDISRKPNI